MPHPLKLNIYMSGPLVNYKQLGTTTRRNCVAYLSINVSLEGGTMILDSLILVVSVLELWPTPKKAVQRLS